ncbi:hypothetical protein [Sedimentitalea todarodis]|uniref:Uncharacterized protein n=1 Tax=Sedimentitalea todarodis TaxID=1631240 RepID=A0ABU3VE45_9RHOB|nr:hypothetical protein [Sedimentitalea todarodis]MDU9004463.1 hypothetical protein [Sedimentitalea todarodis]
MVDIFSKKDGPRREDVAAKRLISENRTTIHRLADQFSGGEFSRSRTAMAKAKEEPKADGLSIHIMGGPSSPTPPEPAVRVSLNGRVIVVDANAGKQMQFLGQMRVKNGQKFFALATKENGFVSPVDDDVEHLLADLNGIVIESDDIENKFVGVIKDRLNL